MVARTGTNVTLPCLGLTGIARSEVTQLVWLCYGCLDSVVVGAAALDASLETVLAQFEQGAAAVLHERGRLSLAPETFALRYEPVLVRHSGRYLCKVNGLGALDATIQLVVQGRRRGRGQPAL